MKTFLFEIHGGLYKKKLEVRARDIKGLQENLSDPSCHDLIELVGMVYEDLMDRVKDGIFEFNQATSEVLQHTTIFIVKDEAGKVVLQPSITIQFRRTPPPFHGYGSEIGSGDRNDDQNS